MRVAIGQINTTVGDLPGNVDLVVGMARKASENGAELVVFPELSLTGYPPRDLLEKPTFFDQSEEQEQRLAAETADLPVRLVYGTIRRSHSNTGKPALNIAAVMERGEVVFE
ncbi:MAG: NAD+ synthase, partial [bacterium]|nr:NAD+ synthase [bacterium]